MFEMWLKIDSLNDYAFSNYGRIYSYRTQEYSTGSFNKKTGYYEKTFRENGKYVCGGGVHKFIYEAFNGKIPYGMEVNHIDGDKSNNAIWNLNLMTHDENRKWLTKEVYQYTLDGQFVEKYESVLQASEKNGIPKSSISACLRKNNVSVSANNYIWSYTNDDSIIKEKIKKVHTKKVLQYTKNGEFITEYKSISEAARITGVERSSISKCCSNKTHFNSAGGYVWKYKEVA